MNITVICDAKSHKFCIPFGAILSVLFLFFYSPHEFLQHLENYIVGNVFSLTHPDVSN